MRSITFFTTILITLFSIGYSQDSSRNSPDSLNSPAFRTPIATTIEESVRLQLIDGKTLPFKFQSELYSLGQPIALRVEPEVAATITVGRSLIFDLPIEIQPEDLSRLVHEACLRVPYNGWREHADLLSDRTLKYWEEFLETPPPERRLRVVPTPFYKFVFVMTSKKNLAAPRELIIYDLALGVDELKDELLKELRESYAMFPVFQERPFDAESASPCENWFQSRLRPSRFHQSVIHQGEDRWPIAIHFRLAPSADRWSAIIGERSGLSKLPKEELDHAVVKALAEFFEEDVASVEKWFANEVSGPDEKASLFRGRAMIVTRSKLDGFDQIEVKFRCRNAE